MNCFCNLFGQKISILKSKAIFFVLCSNVIKNLVKDTFNISSSETFGKYLGFSILNNKPHHANFQFLLENMMKKLASWKLNFLSPTGRLALAKSTLSAIPCYIMRYLFSTP